MSKETGIAGLIERFADLPDARVEGRTDHDLLDIVDLAPCAVMSGAEGRDDIEDWGCEREAWLRRYLRQRNGIPGHDTIRRVASRPDAVPCHQRCRTRLARPAGLEGALVEARISPASNRRASAAAKSRRRNAT